MRHARAPLTLGAFLMTTACGAAPTAGTTAPAPPVEACAPDSFDVLTRQLRDYYCDTAEGSIAASELESCEDIEVVLREPTGAGGGLDARLLQLVTPSGRVSVLMTCAAGQTLGFFLEDQWSETDEEATTTSEATVRRFTHDDFAPGGSSELRLDVAFSRSVEGWHGCTLETSLTERTILCDATPTGPRCAELSLTDVEHAECDELCLMRQLAEEEPTCEDDGGPTYDREYRLALVLDAGRARVIASSAIEATPPEGLVGDHDLEELLVSRRIEPLSEL